MVNLRIEDNVRCEWQQISNLVADFCNVTVALIMRQHQDTIEVVVGSDSPLAPFQSNERRSLDDRQCCQWVIKTQRPLHIINALDDPDWERNPDIKLGMVFYYGVPINMPNGNPFGTLCIQSCEEKIVVDNEAKLIQRFARNIELTLELLLHQQSLYQQSITDDLTGAYNRRHFMGCFEKEFQRARRHNTVFCVAMVDLDHFKRVNDELGHEEGDRVLANFTREFKATIRAEDTLGRVGGEEFALIMPMTTLVEAKHLLERFRCLIEKACLLIDRQITFSAGVAEYTCELDSVGALLGQADKALYEAKQNGRNKV